MGALLLAGLFLYKPNKYLAKTEIVKPSQLDFSNSNQIQTKKLSVMTNEKSVQKTTPSEVQPALEPNEQVKWLVFEDILNTKNDNDPRLDLEFKRLSPEFHRALYERYDKLSPEDHNAKGLIAYLVTRDLQTTDDAGFLKKVFQEAPCLSLPDCKANPSEHADHSAADQTTVVYEKLAVLYSLEQHLEKDPKFLNSLIQRNAVVEILIQAEAFPVPVVHEKARAIRSRFGL